MKKDRQDLLKQLARKINQVLKAMHSQRQFTFGDFHIGRQQAIILFYISENKGAVTVKEIAKFLCVTPGAVTQFIDALAEKKLVKRVVNEQDRRVIIIKLTASAQKILSRFRRDFFLNFSRTFRDLEISELDQLLRLINKLRTPESENWK